MANPSHRPTVWSKIPQANRDMDPSAHRHQPPTGISQTSIHGALAFLSAVLLKKGIKKGIKHTLLQVQTNVLNTLQRSTHAHKP